MSEIEIGVTLAQGLGIMALMALCFGSIERLNWPKSFRSILTGTVFGAGAIIAMLSPATIAPGVIIDARMIMLGVAAAFGGVPAAIVSATIASLYRIGIGGAGTNAALLAIWIASAMGLLWAGTIKSRNLPSSLRLLVLGAMIPISLVASLALPKGTTLPFLSVTLLPMSVSSILAALVLGGFMERELKAIAREQHWKRLASVDGLTGLANRAKFDRTLSKGLDGHPALRPSVALLVIDADHFKRINDTCGHAAGDKVLCEIATILGTSVGDTDLVARLGGEEFGVILETRSPNRVAKIAENIRAAVEGRDFTAIDERLSKVTVSIGYAIAAAGETPDSLYLAADGALYEAKQSGRNHVRAAHPLSEPSASPQLHSKQPDDMAAA